MTHPDRVHAEELVCEGVALHQEGRLVEAGVRYEEALRREPLHARALHNLGLISFQTHQPERAVALISEALRIEPQWAIAHNHRGNALLALQRHAAAIADYDAAIALRTDYAEAHYNRGSALLDVGRCEEAVASFDAAVARQAGYFEAYYNRGLALAALQRYTAAIVSYDAAIALEPGIPVLHASRGLACFLSGDPGSAVSSYDAALALDPQDAQSLYQRGNALRALGRFEAAIESYDRALALDPDSKFLYGLRLHTKMQICDWREFEGERVELARRIERGQSAAPPFLVSTLIDSADLQRRAAQTWCREVCPPIDDLPAIAVWPRRGRIHVGYFSADFREHAVSHLMAGVIETHDRARFMVTGFSFGPDTGDEFRRRLTQGFDRFIDVREMSDRDIALLARSLEVDIAVDLGGFTEGCRTHIFARRAAPLQVSYIGYLGTMAATYMDYLIADATLIPADHRRYYAEKIIQLPSYQANDTARRMSSREFTRSELGLPRTGFVFCCFNANHKITPDTFSSWLRILRAVPDSALFLYAENAAAADNLRREAARHGIRAERLVFGGRLPGPEYLSRYRAADLFLDTWPYNAGTTASDALWTGLPVLTRVGEAFASRMAASLLTAVGLPELITATQAQYETLAIDLASNPQRFADLRRRLAINRQTTRLFDTRSFTRSLESAYSQIHERHLAGLPPDHLTV